MVDFANDTVILCTKCGNGWRHDGVVMWPDWHHHENVWFVPSLAAQGAWCGGQIQRVNRIFACQVADKIYNKGNGNELSRHSKG